MTYDRSNARVKERRLQRSLLEVPGPRDTQGDAAADAAVERAVALTCLVRDEGPNGLGEFLDELDRADLYAVVTALAAMVPDDRPAAELLAWLNPLDLEETG